MPRTMLMAAGLAIASLWAGLEPAWGETVNAVQLVNERLKTKGQFHISTSCSNVCTASKRKCTLWIIENGRWDRLDSIKVRICDRWETVCTATQRRCSPVRGFLSAQSVTAIVEAQTNGKIQRLGLDDTWHRQSATVPNCSAATQTISKNLGFSYVRGHSTTITRGVSTSRATQVGVNASFSFKLVSLGASGSYTVTDSVNVSHARAENRSETVTVSTNVNIVAEPQKETSATVSVFTRRFRMPFTASLLVDGPLSANQAGKTRISDVLSEDERRFTVHGHVDATVGTEEVVRYRSRALECGDVKTSDLIVDEPIAFTTPGDAPGGLANKLFEPFEEETKEFSMTGLSVESLMALAGQFASSNGVDVIKFPGVIAEGRHQCQSGNSIGHSCPVFGYFPNCIAARTALTAQSCCHTTPEGGTSIGFSMARCSPF